MRLGVRIFMKINLSASALEIPGASPEGQASKEHAPQAPLPPRNWPTALSVLLLEAGPEIGKKDFDPSRKKPPASAINIWERARATLKGQPVQARAAFFTERFSRFFVDDRKTPIQRHAASPSSGSEGGRRAAACTASAAC